MSEYPPSYGEDHGSGWAECDQCNGTGYILRISGHIKTREECRACRGTGSCPDADISEVERDWMWAERNRD